jgi:DNA-binding NarL/FixJ family response regulator
VGIVLHRYFDSYTRIQTGADSGPRAALRILPAMNNDYYMAGADMKVFVVEDSAVVRERLLEMISEIEDVEVVGEADTYVAAVAGIMNTRPDVAVLDIKLADDGGSGIDVLAEVKKGLPAMRAIVFSNYATPQHMKASADAGAEYFLDKSADFERIAEILTQIKDEAEGC